MDIRSGSVLRDLLFELSNHEGRPHDKNPEQSRMLLFSLLSEIESCDSIDLHYTGHAKEPILGDRQLTVLLTAMQEVDLSRLEVLNLSGCVIGNSKIITILAELMRLGDLPSLSCLDLSGHYTMTDEGTATLASALRSGRFSKLQHLGLPRCNIDFIVDAIQEGNMWQLKHLIFSGSNNAKEPRSSIHCLLQKGYMTKLEKLVIKSRSIDTRGIVAMAKALHNHPLTTSSLQTLDLSSNYIGNVGSIALARLINDGNLVNLQHLRLYSCSIDGDQMEALVQGLNFGVFNNLEHLDLSWNKFKDQGAIALARVIRTGQLSSLRRLNLGYCDIGTEYWLSHGMLAILEALGEGNMLQLEWLNLLGNQIGAATTVANTIAEMLEMVPALQSVNVIDNRQGNRALKEALDLVLRYPISEFTVVYSGLKRKTDIRLYGECSRYLKES